MDRMEERLNGAKEKCLLHFLTLILCILYILVNFDLS